jgi:hypothetical protein
MTEPSIDQPPVMEPSVEPAVSVATLTPLAQQYLDQTRPWVRFISIMTFVSAGFMLVVGGGMMAFSVYGGIAARNQGEVPALGSAIGAGVMSLVYLVMAIAYVAPGVYLFRYASAIRNLKANSNATGLEDTLKHQRSFWRYVGILMAVTMVLAVIVFVLAIALGAFAAMMAARSSGLRT